MRLLATTTAGAKKSLRGRRRLEQTQFNLSLLIPIRAKNLPIVWLNRAHPGTRSNARIEAADAGIAECNLQARRVVAVRVRAQGAVDESRQRRKLEDRDAGQIARRRIGSNCRCAGRSNVRCVLVGADCRNQIAEKCTARRLAWEWADSILVRH